MLPPRQANWLSKASWPTTAAPATTTAVFQETDSSSVSEGKITASTAAAGTGKPAKARTAKATGLTSLGRD
eukprot:CAMPEP_0115132094 /NCGR_PEP_ID=MMETSP0227-20121206/53529_1 /TAXON_ID=89957 /ORGANISM="Polarella glacialis, Strain CCMP 1383" /LENGTH=70 /DNA_ID=CAMNT_0002537783 /DNA_START=55 /DNA_END=264 /DNA_ORIENTATION=+